LNEENADKKFTVEEVEALIPKLEQVMLSIMDNKRGAAELSEELAKLQRESRRTGGKGIDPSSLMNKQTEIDFLVQIISEGLEALEELGGMPKDLDMGLVDFPAVIDGESVLLCWRYGEKSIDYYHNLSDGFAGRKPVKRAK
jgi:hypothetical protein